MDESVIRAMAIKRFARGVTLPLLLDLDPSAGLQATGTLFKIDGRSFIVTARHSLDVLGRYTIGFPESQTKGPIHTLGNFDAHMPSDGQEHIDVAVIELKSPEVIAVLDANWQFLSLANVANASRFDVEGAYVVAGYPVSASTRADSSLKTQFIAAFTQMCPVPEQAELPVVPDMDFFFDYSKTGISLEGVVMPTPEMPGVSGASVWELQLEASGIWTAETSLRVVAVQTSYLHSKYLRAKSWWAVAKVLEQVDARIAQQVRERFR